MSKPFIRNGKLVANPFGTDYNLKRLSRDELMAADQVVKKSDGGPISAKYASALIKARRTARVNKTEQKTVTERCMAALSDLNRVLK